MAQRAVITIAKDASLLAYPVVSGLLVLLGVLLGHSFVPASPRAPSHLKDSIVSGMLAWDGECYQHIVDDGYDFSTTTPSTIPYFPLYPDLASMCRYAFGVSSATGLLIVSNVAFAACFVLLDRLLAGYGPTDSKCDLNAPSRANARMYTLLALGVLPTTFYFRMAYSESVFLALALATFLAMQRDLPLWCIAVLCGAATEARAVGVALIPSLLVHLYSVSSTWRSLLWRSVIYVPLACWGVLWFMAYQWLTFGAPTAFLSAQAPYNTRPWATPTETVASVLTLEPLWNVYVPNTPGYWARYATNEPPPFSLFFMNPILFLGSIALVIIGAVNRWLTSKELVFSIGVCLVPYVAHSYPKCGASLGRYAVVCFPIYIVIGKLLAAAGPGLAGLCLSVSASLLCIYAALFSRWYWFY